MNLDHIVSQLRHLAANATRAVNSPDPECGAVCAHDYRAEAMAARFTELDVVLSNNGRLPKVWSSLFVPSSRDPQ